jgi:hypothetical protein
MSCDNNSICDQYLPVLRKTHTSAKACLQACADVDNAYREKNPVNICNLVSKDGLSWCQRFCRETYVGK